jgi:hypothetical protein
MLFILLPNANTLQTYARGLVKHHAHLASVSAKEHHARRQRHQRYRYRVFAHRIASFIFACLRLAYHIYGVRVKCGV